MPLAIIRNDITKMNVDAIVNAANTSLKAGGGVCGAVFKAAGWHELQEACDRLAPIHTGEAVITPGFALAAKYVIHAAGPVYNQWSVEQSEKLLHAAYTNSLKIAIENGCESIAFPLISSGIYGYPKAEALRVATSAIRDFIATHDIDVSLVVFDKAAFAVSEKLLGEVKAYIDENYVDLSGIKYGRNRFLRDAEQAPYFEKAAAQMRPFPDAMPAPAIIPPAARIDDLLGDLDEPFSATLLRLIDAKGKSDAEIYKRANIDRKLFSKIRNPEYRPSKKTAVALSIALELSFEETSDLLKRAGFALSQSQKFDVIVKFFITRGKYDIYEINNVLFEYDQPLLGG